MSETVVHSGIRSSSRRHVWLILCYLCGYVALDWASYIYPVAPRVAITPWNPPPGLSLVLLLRCGLRNGPWLFVAAVAAELLVRGPNIPPLLLIVASALPAVVYTALTWLLRGPLRFAPDFTTLRDATIFVAAVAGATGVLAVAFVGVFDIAGLLPGPFPSSVAEFWIGDLIGIVVTTPLLLVLTRRNRITVPVSALELAGQFGSILAALWVVFGSGWVEELKLFYVLFLPLIWISMRDGFEGTTIATMIIQIGLIAALRVGGYHAGTALELQFLMLAVAVTGLFLGMTVSDRKAIAQQLREKQFELDRSLRLASASEMASALAHELKQPLAAIGNYIRACQLLVGDERRSPQALRSTMDKVVVEVNRAGDVVGHLRDFFRNGSGQLAPIEVGSLLRSSIDIARQRTERHYIRWLLECPTTLPAVLVDRVQVETVLHNLISNAVEALDAVPVHNRQISIVAELDTARFVRISVADTGPGLSSSIEQQLFRPFATSKPLGMGLGLAICRSIVEARGGRLWFERIARGSVFRFTLPVA